MKEYINSYKDLIEAMERIKEYQEKLKQQILDAENVINKLMFTASKSDVEFALNKYWDKYETR